MTSMPEGARNTQCPACGWTYGTHSPNCSSKPPAWALGYSVPMLTAFTVLFREHDKGFVLGQFSSVNEAQCARWLADGELLTDTWNETQHSVSAAIVLSRSAQARPVRDFADRTVTRLSPGVAYIKRVAGTDRAIEALVQKHCGVSGPAMWELWQERALDRYVAEKLGFRWFGSKVRASSEIVGLWARGLDGERPTAIEQAALVKLKMPRFDVGPLVFALQTLQPRFEQHYSTYNRGRSWTALALRGYGGQANFIEKPAEMSKKWKAANDEKLMWELQDTPLRLQLPEAEPIIQAIPGRKHRIRLMALAPGGGELTRHADITDPDAGVAEGMLMRIHIPLVTNDSVRFRQWLLDGHQRDVHMGEGEAWYLDTRKPHTAKNDGGSERIHLVMDVESCPELLELIE
jgi:hypothetical protein